MRDPVPPLKQTATFHDIADRFLTSPNNFLPVVDDRDALVGLVALQDLKEYLNAGQELNGVIAYDVMRPPPPCLTPNQKLLDALPVLLASELRNVPVINSPKERNWWERSLAPRRSASFRKPSPAQHAGWMSHSRGTRSPCLAKFFAARPESFIVGAMKKGIDTAIRKTFIGLRKFLRKLPASPALFVERVRPARSIPGAHLSTVVAAVPLWYCCCCSGCSEPFAAGRSDETALD